MEGILKIFVLFVKKEISSEYGTFMGPSRDDNESFNFTQNGKFLKMPKHNLL
jgi:hypothetical protein